MSSRLRQFVRARFRGIAHRLFPQWLQLHDARSHARRLGILRVARVLVPLCRGQVNAGPFAGMRYLIESHGSALCPKLIGSYEAELFPVLQTIFDRGYRRIIDVGAAEGYYIVGLARRIPEATVVAYDISSRARRLCRKLAALNGVASRVDVRGRCDGLALNREIVDGTLVICDCEGYEFQLLNLATCPNLARADMLVEFHDFLQPGLTQTIVNRFANSHACQLVATAPRNSDEYPLLANLPQADRQIALNETRPCAQSWGYFQVLRK